MSGFAADPARATGAAIHFSSTPGWLKGPLRAAERPAEAGRPRAERARARSLSGGCAARAPAALGHPSAIERIAASVDALERAVSVARWSTAPDSRRWKTGLKRYPVGKRHGGTPAGELLETLRALPTVLAAVELPGEEREPAKLYFGYGGGKQATG
jgi:hypothetical protein